MTSGTLATTKKVQLARWLPACGLLLALSTVWLFTNDRDVFYGYPITDWNTGKNMAIAANLPAESGFMFLQRSKQADGTVRYQPYNSFPIGSFVLVWLAIAPFEGDFSSQLAAARMLMLAFFCAAAALAYLALVHLTGDRAIALGATLLAFSSFCLLYNNDVVSNEASVNLFALMLVFHAMVLFKTAGRGEVQLAVKTCAALLLDWHVYGLLLPFLVLGVAADVASAWRLSVRSTAARRLATVAAGVLRGHSVRFAALALLFGVGVLSYNIAREYAALDGQAVAELPSVRSALLRTGFRDRREDEDQPNLLEWQFHRIAVACIPFALLVGDENKRRVFQMLEEDDQLPPLFVWLGVCATLGALFGLAAFKGPWSPPAALILACFGWALLASNHEGNRIPLIVHFEGIIHVGVPLCLFAAVLCGLRRLGGRSTTAVCAAAAATIFALSSAAMNSQFLRDASLATRGRTQLAEFDAIAETIQGADLEVRLHRSEVSRFIENHAVLQFLTSGSFLRPYRNRALATPDHAPRPDFVLAFERYPIPALLTPSHQQVFLYEGGAHYDAVLAAMRNARVKDFQRLRARTPAVAAAAPGFDIHILSHEEIGQRMSALVYLKSPCGREDTDGSFYLHLYSTTASPRWPGWYGHHDFRFRRYGWVFGDRCMMVVPVPPQGVAYATTGQLRVVPANPRSQSASVPAPTLAPAPVPSPAPAIWQTVLRLDLDRLRTLLRATRDETPLARSEFDLYLRDRELSYVRIPCDKENVRGSFFLHVVPSRPRALPAARRRHGFDNLDFEFRQHGAFVGDACVASVTLPDYAIAWLRTGQTEAGGDAGAGGKAWKVEFTL